MTGNYRPHVSRLQSHGDTYTKSHYELYEDEPIPFLHQQAVRLNIWKVYYTTPGRFSKNVQIRVTEFYLLEKALNSNWKWFHQFSIML